MKLATAAEMRELDRLAWDRYGIPGLLLMENAGRAVAAEVMALLLEDAERAGGSGRSGRRAVGRRPLVSIWCGKGNNGGDGFCAARHLLELGAEVRVVLFAEASAVGGDARVNLEIIRRLGVEVAERPAGPTADDQLWLARSDTIVDALLGTGFSGIVRGPMGSAIQAINEARKPVVSVDVPSGLDADGATIPDDGPGCVRADVTVTLGLPKRGLVAEPGLDWVGELVVAPISMPRPLLEGDEVLGTLVEAGEAAAAFPDRPRAAHKGDFGHLLVIAGARGYTGAPVLAALGALRTGAGLVTLAVPTGIWPVVGRRLREVMVQPVAAEGKGDRFGPESLPEVLALAVKATAVVVGPGLGRDPATIRFVRELIARLDPDKPLAIDADGLNALVDAPAEVISGVSARGPRTVLTPHPGEMARLLGSVSDEVRRDRFGAAAAAVERLGAVVLLKGAGTVVAAPREAGASRGRYFVNSTGNPGLASGGTGDVLTGVIGALLAQGRPAVLAAAAGAYVHGRAADRLASRRGQAGLAAGDLPGEIPAVIRELQATHERG